MKATALIFDPRGSLYDAFPWLRHIYMNNTLSQLYKEIAKFDAYFDKHIGEMIVSISQEQSHFTSLQFASIFQQNNYSI